MTTWSRTLHAAALTAIFLGAGEVAAFAHGGEDHSADQPAAVTGESSALRSARAHGIEIALKHGQIEPDLPTPVRLFVTTDTTNQPVENVSLLLSIEGAPDQISLPAASGEIAGMYEADIPSLPEGEYAISAQVTHHAESFVVRFGKIPVGNHEHEHAEDAGWLATVMSPLLWITIAGLVALAIVWTIALSSSRSVRRERLEA